MTQTLACRGEGGVRLRATGSCGVASQQLVSRVEDKGQSSQREGGVRLRATGSCGVASQQLVSRVEDEGQSSQREGSVRLRAKRFQLTKINEVTWGTYFC